MFNINDAKYCKLQLTPDNLFEEVTDYEIYRYYIGEFKVGKAFCSPFRNDTSPSFGIFPSKKELGKLFFKDHNGESGGVIKFVQIYYNCSFREALEKIVFDFKLDSKFEISTNHKQLKPVEYRLDKKSRKEYIYSKMDLKITSRAWSETDYTFWKNYGISKSTLDTFNVTPIEYYWMYGKIYKADKYAYAYKEWKDNELNYKVYQPFRDSKNHKFLNGFLDGTFSGWELLPKYTDTIIITKSTKDLMFLYEHGYYAISPQGEGYEFKKQVIDILKSKCRRLILFYDNDSAGITSAEKRCKEFDLSYIIIDDKETKDITDYYKKHGLSTSLELLTKLLK